MAGRHDKRSCTCMCNCSNRSNDNVSNKAGVSSSLLGRTDHTSNTYFSTPKTKWIFVEEKIESERTRTD